MTEVTSTNVERHSDGDLVVVTADLSNLDNGETFTVPHISKIKAWHASATTDAAIGGTVSSNVITFANTGTLSAMIEVKGK